MTALLVFWLAGWFFTWAQVLRTWLVDLSRAYGGDKAAVPAGAIFGVVAGSYVLTAIFWPFYWIRK